MLGGSSGGPRRVLAGSLGRVFTVFIVLFRVRSSSLGFTWSVLEGSSEGAWSVLGGSSGSPRAEFSVFL